nr:RagB/SusD family nutrient uptake outer membrane protein [uncultured Bacteroides sp.]
MKTNKIILSLVMGTLLTTSCVNDFLELEPLDSQTEAIYFKNLTQFQYAANNLHTNIYAWGANTTYPINFDWGTDLVSAGGDDISGINSAGTTDTYWEQTYKWLRPVNILIQKGEGYSNKEEIAGPVGQAYFFRAWHHFFLLKRFGGVPIANAVTDTDDEIVWGSRASRYEVVAQILSDLDVAIEKLKNTTVASTNNDGHVTLEAAKAFKARVCLYEGTFEKYVGAKTDGDGVQSGAGSAKPASYPSVTDMLTMAKNLSKEIIDSKTFELWKGVEDVSSIATVKNPQMYAHTSYYYLFNLEGTDSNPAGLSKSSNKEAIFRSVYDKVNRKSGTNLTHTWPAGMTRKLSDMYLCSDGLPVHLSPLFKGYTDMNAELENRDYRLTACVSPAMDYAWGWGMYKTGARYDVDIYSLAQATYQSVPNLRNAGSGMGGRKFRSELASIGADGDEAMDCMHIRFPEILLIYAEATCELGNGSISDADLDYSINKVRARGGVAPLNAALIAKAASLGGQLTFLGEIRRERAVELYGEGQRLADLCRWGIAEQELAGQPRCGAYIEYNGTDSYLKTLINPTDNKPVYVASSYAGLINDHKITYSYAGLTPTEPGAIVVELAANRKFALKNYLQPIPTDQIKLNPNLKQNPSW